jgi:FkbM family methyltransferase
MIKEIKEHSFFEDKFNDQIVILDLGACRGEFTNEINSLYSIKKVILVEANPTNFRTLQNKENYILYNNVISSRDGDEIQFLEDTNSPYNGSIIFNYFNGTIHKIKSISIKTIMKENNIDYIDLMKIDIEGSEYEILENFDEEDYKKINQITVEFHDFIDPSLKNRTFSIIQKMKNFGYNVISKKIDYMYGSEYYDVLFYK